ncbi:alanine racemase [Tunicatimonas pelagia]|uniref:alanine racemase n=1 Tax=Tunicatimonas pelagia TaxID=931531 RepID=UPI0026658C0E|nr:alanine racemase [Tunicatimonas pelagia]WKN44052.1 alanine racemase [Tunicatimonas pelagia]
MLDLSTIISPTLLLNEQKCQANLKKLTQQAKKHNIQLAPHFKTHQSAQVSQWFRDYGVQAITVTSIKMARYFAKHGWDDITIAMPINIREIEAINSLASQIRLTVFVNSMETARFLHQRVTAPLPFCVEVDTGYHRSGVISDNTEEIRAILATAQDSQLQFTGFYSHAGHTYEATTHQEVERVHQETLQQLNQLKETFRPAYPDLQLSLGDTPSCSLMDDFTGIDIIRPGNFVYYDLTQHFVGSNSVAEIAVCLAAPVVSVHPERNEVVTHSGWAHLGKDSLTDKVEKSWYGYVVTLTESGWSAPIEGAYVAKLSQEHGTLYLPDEYLEKVAVGDLLGILPVHACATVVMMGELTTFSGEMIKTMSVQAV